MRRGVTGGALACLAAAAVAVGFVVHRSGTSAPARARDAHSFVSEASRLPKPEQPAFRVGRPTLLDRRESRARFAPVLRRAPAHGAPSATSPVVATLEPLTTEDTTNIVAVIGTASWRGELWVHVRMPVLPNDVTGWVPRSVLGGYEFVHTHLVVDRARLVATLYRDGRKVFSAPVGVGRTESPTPAGQFYVRDRVSGFGNAFYGPVAFGTSARSAVLTDWPAGGFVGIHGTNEPDLIPGHVSHGCIRLRNADIVRLSRLMPVGTPLTVR